MQSSCRQTPSLSTWGGFGLRIGLLSGQFSVYLRAEKSPASPRLDGRLLPSQVLQYSLLWPMAWQQEPLLISAGRWLTPPWVGRSIYRHGSTPGKVSVSPHFLALDKLRSVVQKGGKSHYLLWKPRTTTTQQPFQVHYCTLHSSHLITDNITSFAVTSLLAWWRNIVT